MLYSSLRSLRRTPKGLDPVAGDARNRISDPLELVAIDGARLETLIGPPLEDVRKLVDRVALEADRMLTLKAAAVGLVETGPPPGAS